MSERQMRLTVDDHALLLLDPDGRVESCNVGVERLTGYRADEIVARHYEAFLSHEDIAVGEPRRQLAIAGRQGRAQAQGFRRRKDGLLFAANVIVEAMRDAGGGLRGFAALICDVTRRSQTGRGGDGGDERFASVAEAAGLAFWDFDATLDPSLWPDRMIAALPSEPGHIHPDDRAGLAGQMSAAATERRDLQSEFRVVQPDGRIRYLRATASLRRDAKGRPHRLFGVSFDMTAQKQAEIGLERARDAAEAANRTKSEFIATMSHEVRTPLNGIVGMSALLLESGLTDNQRKMAAAIREAAEALMSIADEALDISKLEAGRMEIHESDFDLRHLIAAAVDLFAPVAQEKRIVLAADTAGVSRSALRGDALRLRQILLNLLSNAIKFTRSGAVSVVVATADEAPDRVRVRVEVVDDGPGLDRHIRERLFKPFEQASGRLDGTGLGLSISKRLVDLMGGRIGMDERARGGSVFWFDIAIGPALAAAPLATPPCAPDRRTVGSCGRILLAEDNGVNVEVVTLMLEGAGYTVDVAADGNQAVAAVTRRRYDLVLMDMQMPLLDGLEATRAIRAAEHAGARLPIAAMTASATQEDRRRCIDAGMDHYICKPFTPAALIENVSRWIERSELTRACEAKGEPDPPAARLSQLPIVDEAAVERFRSVASATKFIELLGGYLENLDRLSDCLTRLEPPLATDEIGRQAHGLIMGSGTFGARQVQELALLLQTACNRQDAPSVAMLTQSLLSAAATASTALRARYGLAAA